MSEGRFWSARGTRAHLWKTSWGEGVGGGGVEASTGVNKIESHDALPSGSEKPASTAPLVRPSRCFAPREGEITADATGVEGKVATVHPNWFHSIATGRSTCWQRRHLGRACSTP